MAKKEARKEEEKKKKSSLEIEKPKAEKPKKEKKAEAKPKVSSDKCEDQKCPFHGKVTPHGRVFVGTVISDRMDGTVRVEWPRKHYIPKFERYEKRRSRVKAHNPACVDAKMGDKVKIAECRPLAKTVNFVVIEVLK